MKFITQITRDSQGQCMKTTHAVAVSAGVERMGKCEACGHKISDHCPIITPDGQVMYVGCDCEKILCAPNAKVIQGVDGADHKIIMLPIDASLIRAIIRRAYSPTYSKGEFNLVGSVKIQALANIIIATRANGFMTPNQIKAMNEAMGLEETNVIPELQDKFNAYIRSI